jgi:RNA polymerase sigma-70 factor (ECF subfamily)
MEARWNELELVSAAASGAPEAREKLVDLWLPLVLGWCARLGGPRVDPEDAAHDTLVIMLDRLPSLREPRCFPAWIFGITRRVLARHRRQAWVRRWVPGLVPEAADPEATPYVFARLSETSRRVQEALEQVPADQREVLVLCDLEERTDLEVAELLGVPLGTVKSRLRLARARLRRIAEQTSLAADAARVVRGGVGEGAGEGAGEGGRP